MLKNDTLLYILTRSKEAIAVYDSRDLHICFVNNAMLQIWGKDPSVLHRTFEEVLPETKDQPFAGLLKQVWQTGETFTATNTPATINTGGQLKTSLFDFEYEAIKDEAGRTIAILHTASDVSSREQAWQQVGKGQEREDHLIAELKVSNSENQIAQADLNTANKNLQTSNEQIGRLNFRLEESETDFKRLVEKAPVAMMVFRGKEMVIDLVNEAMLEILDKDISIIGKPLLEGLPEIKGAEAVNQLFEVYSSGRPSNGNEAPVPIRRNGELSTRYFNFSYRPLLDQGVIIGVMDVAVDVTELVLARKRLENIVAEKTSLEQILRASEQRLQGILDTMAEGVGIIDTSGQLVYANGMAQRILGLTESEIKDRTYDDPKWTNLRVDGTPLPDEEHPMAIMMSSLKPVYDHEIGVQPPEGKRFYISINAAPIFDEQGELTGGIGTFMDVTSRRLLSQQKDDFISVASHELKTPVTSLKGAIQLLARGRENLPPAMHDRMIDQAVRSLNKLNDLINSLLNTNRMSQGRFPVNKTNFIIADLANASCQHIRLGGNHEVQLNGDLELRVHADEQLIEQVIVNLLNNAVKYAPDSRQIVIEIKRITDAARITVSDFGPGIPADKKEHIFKRYYQAQNSGREFSGLGLGLYICAEIIEKHDGEIGVVSETGRGSTFWFTLPLASIK